jgi:hypothetical protein
MGRSWWRPQLPGALGPHALGHKRISKHIYAMSALPPKADIAKRHWHVDPIRVGRVASTASRRRHRRSSAATFPVLADWGPYVTRWSGLSVLGFN